MIVSKLRLEINERKKPKKDTESWNEFYQRVSSIRGLKKILQIEEAYQKDIVRDVFKYMADLNKKGLLDETIKRSMRNEK